MPIDVTRVVGVPLAETTAEWSADDVILYNLAVGAGVPPTDPRELQWTYERGLNVLPSYGVMAGIGALRSMLEMDGMDVSLASLLHGEQDLEIHGPLPTRAEVRTSAEITGVYDKGKAALVVLETRTRDASDDRPLCTSRVSAFFRGEGGFGGDAGPPPGEGPPDRPADHILEMPTLPQQALLYRLCGDKNPLHADPAFAAKAGFDQPILHGLCSYGMTCKAIVDHVLGGDPARVARYRARFAGVLFPGETLEISAWMDDGHVSASARCVERDAPVLSHVRVELA